jgi:glycosyltransferase involved in cell wall biosynthesis
MVVLEAATRGIPLVCNRVGGLVEILGDYAFYSEDVTYPSFKKALKQWLQADRATLDRITRGARKRYDQNFTEVVMARRYGELFETMA